MTLKLNNPKKPSIVNYNIAYKEEFKTTFEGNQNPVMIYIYHVLTNDKISAKKYKEIEKAIARIMNPEIKIE